MTRAPWTVQHGPLRDAGGGDRRLRAAGQKRSDDAQQPSPAPVRGLSLRHDRKKRCPVRGLPSVWRLEALRASSELDAGPRLCGAWKSFMVASISSFVYRTHDSFALRQPDDAHVDEVA